MLGAFLVILYMTTISHYATNFAKIDIPAQLPKIIERVEPEMIAYNQQQLYRSSIDRLGKALKLYRSASYSLKKYARNPLPGKGRPDLNLTGSLYRGMYVKVDARSYLIGSSDVKETRIERIYGKDIWGLTAESKHKLARNDVRPLLMGYIRNVLRS